MYFFFFWIYDFIYFLSIQCMYSSRETTKLYGYIQMTKKIAFSCVCLKKPRIKSAREKKFIQSTKICIHTKLSNEYPLLNKISWFIDDFTIGNPQETIISFWFDYLENWSVFDLILKQKKWINLMWYDATHIFIQMMEW